MMTHSLHSSIHRRAFRTLRLVAPFVVAVVLWVFSPTMPPAMVEVVYGIGKPVWSVQESLYTSLDGVAVLLSDKEQLLRENAQLQEVLLSAERRAVFADVVKNENDRLSQLLGLTEGGGTLFASVLHPQTFMRTDMFMIGSGEQAGVRERMLVQSPEGDALGVVVRVFDSSSVVRLFSLYEAETLAVLKGETVLHVRLVGAGGQSMFFEAPRDVLVREGDVLVLPHMRTYPLGTVVAIEATPEDAYQTVFVRASTNIHTLQQVVVNTAVVISDTVVIPEEVLDHATTTDSAVE